MRPICCAALAMLWSWTIVAEAPDRLYSENPNRALPIWVSLDAAQNERGALRQEVIRRHGFDLMERVAEMRANDRRKDAAKLDRATRVEDLTCIGEPIVHISKPDRNLVELVASSVSIFAGTIEAVTPGFFEGDPASLLTVKLASQPVASDEYDTSSGRIYIYYPHAFFRVGPHIVCARPATHEARPQPGDRIVAFALLGPADRTRKVLYPQASRHLILETKQGELQLPWHLRESLAGFSDVDALLHRIACEAERRVPIQHDPRTSN